MRYILGIVIVLAAIQLIRPARNISTGPQPDDILVKYHAPADVAHDLRAACYDCHSNNTNYPWYANIQPVGWYLAYHVRNGKRHVNFSEFGKTPAKWAVKKLDHAMDEIHNHGMPLGSYLLMHPEARLTTAQTKQLEAWLDSVRKTFPASVR